MKRQIWNLLMLSIFLAGCADPAVEPISSKPQPAVEAETTSAETENSIPAPQLLAKAESEAQAQEIARLYGIALVEFRRGLAAFYTEEDPGEVIARREPGWPELYHNNVSQAF